jgi:hypothetical protein
MLSEPVVFIKCDFCSVTEEVTLTALARGAYDERNVRSTLEEWGWTLSDLNEDMCPDCSFECSIGERV